MTIFEITHGQETRLIQANDAEQAMNHALQTRGIHSKLRRYRSYTNEKGKFEAQANYTWCRNTMTIYANVANIETAN